MTDIRDQIAKNVDATDAMVTAAFDAFGQQLNAIFVKIKNDTCVETREKCALVTDAMNLFAASKAIRDLKDQA